MPPGAKLHTVEIDDEMEDELRELFADDPRANDIILHIGDAEEVVPSIDETWDMVFIDANKRRYVAYLEMILPRLRRGGYILADNTLWSGKVVDESARMDPQLAGIHEFNSLVTDHPDLETVIIPVRDGLSLIRRR